MGDTTTSTATAGMRTIEISDEAYEVLARTAEHHGTDLDGAVRYLLTVPAVPAEIPRLDGDEPDEPDDE